MKYNLSHRGDTNVHANLRPPPKPDFFATVIPTRREQSAAHSIHTEAHHARQIFPNRNPVRPNPGSRTAARPVRPHTDLHVVVGHTLHRHQNPQSFFSPRYAPITDRSKAKHSSPAVCRAIGAEEVSGLLYLSVRLSVGMRSPARQRETVLPNLFQRTAGAFGTEYRSDRPAK
jgi:hypothetical protein